jgi:16S rRNA (adenine1518-N6/adenine1519-N6)-dimethyltransferase
VESDVVIVEPYRQPPVPVTDPALFRRLVKAAFSQRRKQVANSLRAVCRDPVEILRQVNIDPMRRPETMSLAEFAALANVLASGNTTVSPAPLLPEEDDGEGM